jgi:hypothetical protein
MFTVVRNSVMRSFSTTALIEITSAPVIPRNVFAASCTAASAALAKLSGDEPMTVMTLATSAICSSLPPSAFALPAHFDFPLRDVRGGRMIRAHMDLA